MLLMSAEDEQAGGEVRSRQNVIHEAGLFQASLGWNRAVLVIEEGTEQFSNSVGMVYVSYEAGQVKSVISDVLQAIKREFPDS